MRNGVILGVLLPCLLAGCRTPLSFLTDNRIWVDGPVHTVNKVVMEVPVVPDGGNVVAVSLGGPGKCGDRPKVAVLDVDGLILNQEFTGPLSMGENPVALFREKLDAIACDPTVKAVVLRINTPGGSVTASDILRHDLLAFRERTHLPVIACILDVGAGGGYYLATAADVIVAHPTAVVGGIGVILNLFNLKEMLSQANILTQEVKAGKHIDMGTPLRNLPADVKEMLEKMAKEYHERFIDAVKQTRPRVAGDTDAVFDGRVFTAKNASELGLVDRIGYLDDAVQLAREGTKCADAVPVLYRRSNDPARSLYAVTPNVPGQSTLIPVSVPGLERSKLPTFLYLWQPEATLPRLSGR